MEESKKRELPSTYFVQDRQNKEEMIRLQGQDAMLTSGMGGVLPEQENLSRFQRVLDVGCGTGVWLIALAHQVPTTTLLVGVDVSRHMVEYARRQAQAAGVADRVEFQVMDALRMLEFPRGSFDLVNQRLGMSYLRTWDWPNQLQKYQWVSRSGGIIRITESAMIIESTSTALMQLNELLRAAFQQAGHYFSNDRDGVINALVPVMHQQGLQDVQTRVHLLAYRAGVPARESFARNIASAYRTLVPFLRKWTQVPDDYQTIYQQCLQEMEQSDFHATWKLMTAWGTVSAS